MLKMTAAGLFVTDMEKMVAFYRDVMGMKTDWEGTPNAELYSGDMCLIMFGRKDFEEMTGRNFGYPDKINGTVELALICLPMKTWTGSIREYWKQEPNRFSHR